MKNWVANIDRRLGMREKLIILFVVIKVFPLILLALIAWDKSLNLSDVSNKALQETQELTLEGTKEALTDSARKSIERLTTDAAADIASFLYDRDADILGASYISPTIEAYTAFIKGRTDRMLVPSEWVMDQNDTSATASWKLKEEKIKGKIEVSSNKDNDRGFISRPADSFIYENVPLFREVTFVDLDGQEQIKITRSPLMDKKLKNISQKENTFIKAENYFESLTKLKEGEIYVSDVIGAYVPSKVIGIYNKFNVEKRGLEYDPESAAFAGEENPVGKHFEGIVRWATPVYENGQKVGYVTLALNYDHILKAIASVSPTDDRYTELSDAHRGNYTFVWDYKGRNIGHPRNQFIVGYNPETGDPAMPWLETKVYERWQESGKSYVDFIVDEPMFFEQGYDKSPSPVLTKSGYVGLDCRYMKHAPQCTGWFDLAKSGGSGSFVLLWSGLTKLSTAAAIPYYTGQYAADKVGFGVVTISAELDEFLSPATETGLAVEAIIEKSNKEMKKTLLQTAYSLTLSTILMTLAVIFVAVWLASSLTKRITFISNGILKFRNGEKQFRFNKSTNDEIGIIYESFDVMAENLEKSTEGLCVITDLDRNIIYANEPALVALEISLEDAVGKNYDDVSNFGEANPLMLYLSGHAQEIQKHPLTKLYYKIKVEELYDDKHVHSGYTLYLQDINDLILQQQEIDLQRSLLLTVFASSPDVIWYKDATNKYLSVNPRFCAIMGKKNSDVLDKIAEDILPGNLLYEDSTYDKQARNDKVAVYSEEEYTFSDGHHEILEIVRTPIFNAKDEYVGIVGVARDVSTRINIENNLRETQSSLEKAVFNVNKADASKSAFLARMSHEIRTPMNAILGMSTIAKDQLESPKNSAEDVYSHISQIEVSAKHLLSLVNEILETSKVDATTITLRKEAFAMGRLIKDVGIVLNEVCLEKQVKLDIDMPDLDYHNVFSDPTRIRQVIMTLLHCAINHTCPNEVVHLAVEQEQVSGNETRLTFTIQSNGSPMDSQQIEAIEHPMAINSALINARILDENFTLSLAQHIVYHLGGKIRVEPTSEGNTIIFAFRLEQLEKNKELDAANTIDLGILSGKRILIVDDVNINRIILKGLLSKIDIEIEEAADGMLAAEMFQNSPIGYYDVILMDIQMPRMNGFEATEAIRQSCRPDASVPIIAVTANTFQEDIKKTMDSGMDAHFSKPVNRDNLFTAIATLLMKTK